VTIGRRTVALVQLTRASSVVGVILIGPGLTLGVLTGARDLARASTPPRPLTAHGAPRLPSGASECGHRWVDRSKGLDGHARGGVAAVGKADVAALPSGSAATVPFTRRRSPGSPARLLVTGPRVARFARAAQRCHFGPLVDCVRLLLAPLPATGS
jgi:hypothetical protein